MNSKFIKQNGKKIIAAAVLLMAMGSLYGCKTNDSGNLVLTGSVEGNEYTVVAEGAGKLTTLTVSSGDEVKEGMVLGQIDDKSLQIQRKNLELLRQISELKYQDMKNGSSKSKIQQSIATRDQVKAQLEGSDKELAYLNQQLSDIKALVVSGAGTGQSEKDIKQAIEREQTKRNALQEQYRAAQAGLNVVLEGAVTEQLKQGLLDIQIKTHDIEAMDLTIEKYKIKSPCSGYVQTVNYDKGEVVSGGQKLFSIIDPKRLELKVYVAEKNMHQVSLGMPVVISGDFKTDKPIQGKVTYIASSAEFTPKNTESKESKQEMVFEVRVSLNDPSGMVKPGMYLDADFGSDR